jgi:hypothetical protein
LPRPNHDDAKVEHPAKRISATQWDLYWESDENLGREQLLETLVEEAQRGGWSGDFDNGWADWDIKLVGDRWHNIRIRTATEELGWPHRFTRARCTVRTTQCCRLLGGIGMVWSAAAVLSLQPWAMVVGLISIGLVLVSIPLSRRRCLRAVTALVARAGRMAQLQPVGVKVQPTTDSPQPSAISSRHLEPDQENRAMKGIASALISRFQALPDGVRNPARPPEAAASQLNTGSSDRHAEFHNATRKD